MNPSPAYAKYEPLVQEALWAFLNDPSYVIELASQGSQNRTRLASKELELID